MDKEKTKNAIKNIMNNDNLSKVQKITAIDELLGGDEPEEKVEPVYVSGYYKPKNYGGELWVPDWEDNKLVPVLDIWHGTDMNFEYLNLGQSFKTEEECSKYCRQQTAYKKLIHAIAEENKRAGFVVSLELNEQSHWFFTYNCYDECLMIKYTDCLQHHPITHYFDHDSEETLINQLGEPLIKLALWGIEDEK